MIVVTGILLAVTLAGCIDPVAADMEAEHRELGQICEQELRQGLSAFSPTSQAQTLRPAL